MTFDQSPLLFDLLFSDPLNDVTYVAIIANSNVVTIFIDSKCNPD